MGRWAGSGKTICEACNSIDVNRWHRHRYLRQSSWFSWGWTRGGEPARSITVRTEPGTAILSYRTRSYGGDWEAVEQRVPITWTACHFCGQRPWFTCPVYSNGRYCGRRVAKLYMGGGKLFAWTM
jgi:hypothetical protein